MFWSLIVPIINALHLALFDYIFWSLITCFGLSLFQLLRFLIRLHILVYYRSTFQGFLIWLYVLIHHWFNCQGSTFDFILELYFGLSFAHMLWLLIWFHTLISHWSNCKGSSFDLIWFDILVSHCSACQGSSFGSIFLVSQ